MTPKLDLSTPQARRRASTDARLRDALGSLANDPTAQATVAALARAAGVGRNIIYTHHAEVLDALRNLQAQRVIATKTMTTDKDRTRSVLHEAEMKITALATQNAGLLQRTVEAEQRAERLERRNAQLVQELDRIRRPASIRRDVGKQDPSTA